MSWPADHSHRAKELLNQLATGAVRDLRLAVLAAHPDDETIGASALLAKFPSARIVFLTDGAPEDQRLWPPGIHGSRDDYAALRRSEARNALAYAGIQERQISYLGAIDQQSILNARGLARKLVEFIEGYLPNVLVTHPYEGGHPDHDCAALVAKLAERKLGTAAPAILEMTSYHARGGQCVTGEFLQSAPLQEIRFEMSESDRERKGRMMAAYVSQRLVLENFSVERERLRIAPDYDFSRPAHAGQLWYELVGWTTGERWRELASAASNHAQECACD